jgi:hypothetical protein
LLLILIAAITLFPCYSSRYLYPYSLRLNLNIAIMGCISHRKKETREFADQKWDYINLADFKSKGCGEGFAYVWLWGTLITSVAVYAVDSFTAVNLLVFDRWASSIEPGIPFNISKWIFAVCIILSFINLAYEGIRAWRVIKRGNVAECYLDSLAVRWESIRMGSGQGWKRFLVFAELTKSKKGGEYIALFTYFSFQTWIRVILCSGPRQVINVFTLKGVYETNLLVNEKTIDGSFVQFFKNIGKLYSDDYRQAAILSGMCFTLVIWVFSALFLLASVLFYVFFLFHWLPRADGGLSGYCERKVNKALLRIVTEKVNKALAKGQAQRYHAEAKAAEKLGKPELARAATLPTLPTLPNVGPLPAKEDSLPSMPVLGRNETMSTLPVYTSRAPSPTNIEMSAFRNQRPAPSRAPTVASYSSRAPLMDSAADMGYDAHDQAVPTLPQIDLGMLPPARPGTAASQRSYSSRPGAGHATSNSGSSIRVPYSGTPGPMGSESQFGGPARTATMDSSRQGSDYFQQPGPPMGRSYEAYDPTGRSSPAPSYQYNGYSQDSRMNPAPSRTYDAYNGGDQTGRPPMGPPSRSATGPMGPGRPGPAPAPLANRSATGPIPARGPGFAPQRNMTAPMPSRGPGPAFSDRSNTAQGMRGPANPGYGSSNTPGNHGQPRGDNYGYDVERGNYGY